MILNEKTLGVMKNFSLINQSLLIKPGKTLKTIVPLKTMTADATLDQEFPKEACIYDLPRFLSVLSLYKEPDVDFKDDHFIISEGKRKTRYGYAEPSMIVLPPTNTIVLKTEDVKINLQWADIESTSKAASRLGLPEIAIVGENGKVFLKASNSEDTNSNADSFSTDLGVEVSSNFKFTFGADKLKMIQQNYDVTICFAGIAKFVGEYVTYFIAAEQKTSYFNK